MGQTQLKKSFQILEGKYRDFLLAKTTVLQNANSQTKKVKIEQLNKCRLRD